MCERLDKFVEGYLTKSNGKWKGDELYDAIKREFPDLSNQIVVLVITNLLLGGNVPLYTKIREWFENAQKRHAQGYECEFPALNKYFEALEQIETSDTAAAKDAIKEAKRIMNNDASNGNTFVKDFFCHFMDELYSKLNS